MIELVVLYSFLGDTLYQELLILYHFLLYDKPDVSKNKYSINIMLHFCVTMCHHFNSYSFGITPTLSVN